MDWLPDSQLVIEFNEFNIAKTVTHAFIAAPVVSFAVLVVPLLDTLRVIIIRLLNGYWSFCLFDTLQYIKD